VQHIKMVPNESAVTEVDAILAQMIGLNCGNGCGNGSSGFNSGRGFCIYLDKHMAVQPDLEMSPICLTWLQAERQVQQQQKQQLQQYNCSNSMNQQSNDSLKENHLSKVQLDL